MLRYLFFDEEEKTSPPTVSGPVRRLLLRDAEVPMSVASFNELPHELKQRVVRLLIPPELLVAHGINPIRWENEDEGATVVFTAEAGTNRLHVAARAARIEKL